ncbi:glycosyltransferase [Candidatus Sumerlaeota bacterium]|nr:glycosyltransferase [Candidatus Sumerlaeota bacterium]
MNNKSETIIVVGVGPVPLGNPERVYATGLRLFAFSKHIRKAGFRVLMGEASFEGGEAPCGDSGEIESGWERRGLPLDPHSASVIIGRWAREEKPCAIVSTTDVMNYAAALLDTRVPRWMDFFGHPMAERQELSYVHESDEGLIEQWSYIIPSLLTGDRFSACSTPQKFALTGELGAVGRLNRHNSGEDLVSVIKPGAVFHESQPDETRVFRGKSVPEDAFCLLWNGGFNTWVDEGALFEGVCLAMKESEKIHFIITGGEIRGHDEKTFERFKERVKNSPFSSRFHFFGWVPLKRLPNFYNESDAAINIDRFTYEAMLGVRNRLFSWMNYNLPVITTTLSENTKNLALKGIAVGFSPGNARELAEGVLTIMRNPVEAREMAQKARKYLLEECDYQKILAPLLEWLEHPRIAPDRRENVVRKFDFGGGFQIGIPENSLSFLHARFAKEREASRRQEERKTRVRKDPDDYRSSQAHRWMKRLKKLFGG